MASASTTIRKILFQVHLWVGLILGIFMIALGISGTALMWPDSLMKIGNAPPAVRNAAVAQPLATYMAAGAAALPEGQSAQAVFLPTRPGEPVRVAGGGRGPSVWLDPGTAEVLKVGSTASPAFRLAHDLHGALLMPVRTGRPLVGWLGIPMLLLGLSGIWLWWPRGGGFLKGFRWRRTPSTLMNLHYMSGFWLSIPLIIVSVTGIAIAFPQLVGAAGPGGPPGAGPGGPARGAPLQPRLGIDEAVAAAMQAAPGAHLISVTRPSGAQRPGASPGGPPAWRVQLAGQTPSEVLVDDATGAVRPAPAPVGPPPGPMRTIRQLHQGEGNLIWFILVALTGIVPVVAGVTGTIQWARLELRKSRARRQSAGA
jgi:uncharacterized iron-regulated membrane protein